jgi:hypothetical protein
VHNTPDGGVEHVPEQAFTQGRAIYIEQRAVAGQETLVVQRALALVGRKYDLFAFNCEHAANLAANGRAESSQLQGMVRLGLAVAGLMLVNQNGSAVDENGYRRDASGRFASRLWW